LCREELQQANLRELYAVELLAKTEYKAEARELLKQS
jgi:uncharacterized protein YqgQ